MNNKFQELVNGLGALTEIWTLTYKNFCNLGFNQEEALTHTMAFTKVMMNNIPNQGEE